MPPLGLAKHPLVQLEQNWHESAKQCAFEEVAKMDCFMKNNCVLKASETEVQKVVKQCYKEFDVVKCIAKNVPG
ncbi:hypothetical protein niasHT_008992 [Heterodera trifolii]|uniref:Uncharacterized protein n=1 Tax=Heterodera trifolii TaxID=157864 RepID=A0ABD2LW52_9BILA